MRQIIFHVSIWNLCWDTCDSDLQEENKSLLTCVPRVYLGATQEKMSNSLR